MDVDALAKTSIYDALGWERAEITVSVYSEYSDVYPDQFSSESPVLVCVWSVWCVCLPAAVSVWHMKNHSGRIGGAWRQVNKRFLAVSVCTVSLLASVSFILLSLWRRFWGTAMITDNIWASYCQILAEFSMVLDRNEMSKSGNGGKTTNKNSAISQFNQCERTFINDHIR